MEKKNTIPVKILMHINRFFKPPIHPFNLQNDGIKTYAEWQYERGADTVKFFTDVYSEADLFEGKRILDMGCGAGGKSLYYASKGAEKVVGVDLVEKYREESLALAEKVGLTDKFEFVCASAYELPFEDQIFDTIVMNDFMEHVDKPEKALKEGLRLLAPGGKLLVNFPPYFHPWGAHLSDAIYIPWVQLFFSEKTMISAYEQLVSELPDRDSRLNLRFSVNENGEKYISYINKMTLKRYKNILKKLNILPDYYKEVPLRKIFSIFAKIPGLSEIFVKMAVCSIQKN